VSAWLWVLIVAAILVVAVLILTTSIRSRRSAQLRDGFGPEYDRTVERDESRDFAELIKVQVGDGELPGPFTNANAMELVIEMVGT
jgi:hypothetical protein